MTSANASFREALRRLHQAKDAAYRDAWKRRGEVISILANIARKAGRLGYGLGGAPAARDESRPPAGRMPRVQALTDAPVTRRRAQA
ncbi:MAG TPA: hypothetical protein VGA04_22150 [Streptosporangiaceae bacterium]